MMQWRGNKFWLNVYFAAAVLLLALMVAGSIPAVNRFAGRIAADFFYPYISISGAAGNFVSDKTLLALDKTKLASVLEQTREELAAAKVQAERTAALANENRALRELLKLRPPRNFRYVAAQVQLFDPLYWKEHFTLDKGSRDGVTKGAAVIAMVYAGNATAPAVAGFVSEVSANSCEVASLYNPVLRVPVRLEQSNAVGFLNGENVPAPLEELTSLSYLPPGGTYRIGETAVTVDFDSGVPAGLRLGELARLDSGNNRFDGSLYRRGYLRPALTGLDAVKFVVIAVPEE